MTAIQNDIDLPTSGRIQDAVHIFPVRVHWEDTDAGGIVYHASYLRFMERGRSEMLRVLGLDQAILREEHGLNYVVKHLAIDYQGAGRFDMSLQVLTSITSIGGASLGLIQKVLHKDRILTDATVKCVGISQDGKPMRAPNFVRHKLKPMLK